MTTPATGGGSLGAAMAEFCDAAMEYLNAFLADVLWTDATLAAHAVCTHRRLLTATGWLGAELQRRCGVTSVVDANYDDDTIAELLGGIQG